LQCWYVTTNFNIFIFGKIKKNILIHSWFADKAARHKSGNNLMFCLGRFIFKAFLLNCNSWSCRNVLFHERQSFTNYFNVLRVLRVILKTHIPKNSTHADNYTPDLITARHNV